MHAIWPRHMESLWEIFGGRFSQRKQGPLFKVLLLLLGEIFKVGTRYPVVVATQLQRGKGEVSGDRQTDR